MSDNIAALVARLTTPIDWKLALTEGDIWQIEEDRREAAQALTRIAGERDALKAALMNIAAFDDEWASARWAKTGSYSAFDEPGSVEIARKALGETP